MAISETTQHAYFAATIEGDYARNSRMSLV